MWNGFGWNAFAPFAPNDGWELGFGAAEPFDRLRRLLGELDELGHLGQSTGAHAAPTDDAAARPRVARATLTDAETHFVLDVELPGLGESDVDVSVHDDVVTVRGKRDVAPPGGVAVHRRERASFDLARSFALPAKVEAERATASMKNGVLRLDLPKVPESRPRQIPVQAS